MQVRLLGPVEALVGGTAVRFRGGRERALLARLALAAGRVIGNSRLVEDIWGAQVIDGAVPALHVYVSRLRSSLRAAGVDNVLLSYSGGYALDISADHVDALEFGRLSQLGLQQLTAGEPAAGATLVDALNLWRGYALSDIGDVPFASAERARLEEERVAALEARIQADLAAGEHRRVLTELETLTAAHPFRERFWAQWMLALYRDGRQAEALAVYQKLRALLLDELGVDPTPELQRMEKAILRQEPDLESPILAAPMAPLSARAVGDTAVSLPRWAQHGGPVVGRDEELERLHTLRRLPETRIVFVSGEPGIGKTTLALRVAADALAEGTLVLVGRCEEDLGLPYQPVLEALRDFVQHTDPADLPVRLGDAAGELTRVLPELDDLCPDLPPPINSDPETERYRLFEAVSAWLRAAHDGGPVLLLIDDIQWATNPTLLMIRHILQSSGTSGPTVIAAYRDTELSGRHPLRNLIAEVRADGIAEHLAMVGLDQAGVAAFLRQTAGVCTVPDDSLTRPVWNESGGNPLYLAQLLKALQESGTLTVASDGRWAVTETIGSSGVPPVLRDVLHRRIDRLSEPTRRLLSAGAVIGAEFAPALSGRVAGLDAPDVLDAVDEAIRAHLVHEVAGPAPLCRFSHALVRHYLYEQMSRARRTVLHRALRTELETLPTSLRRDQLPTLARHAARSAETPNEAEVAAGYMGEVAAIALRQLAHDEAADAWQEALDLWRRAGVERTDPRVLQALIGVGEAWRRLGDPRSRDTLLRAATLAREVGDVDALTEAALANGRGNIYSVAIGLDAERIKILESALDSLERSAVGQRRAARARLLAGLGLELAWQPDPARRVALSDEAVDLARAQRDPATLAGVLLARDYTIASPTNAEERLANTAEVLDLADQIGDPVLSSRALLLRYRAAMDLGDASEAERCLSANEELQTGLHQPTLSWPVQIQRAGLTLLRGAVDVADAAWTQAYELGLATGQPDAETYRWTGQVQIRLEQGRGEEIEAETRDRIERTPLAVAESFLATILDAAGRVEELQARVAALSARQFTAPFDFLWLRFQCDCASACIRGGTVDDAALLYDNLSPFTGRLSTIMFGSLVAGAVDHYLGMLATRLGRVDAANTHFAAAAALHHDIDAPAWLARTHLEWARMFRTRAAAGDDAEAERLRAAAVSAARRLDLPALLRAAETV